MIPSVINALTERMHMGGFTLSAYLTPSGDVEVESFIDVGSVESETSRYSVGRAQGDYAPCLEGTVPDAFTIEDCIRGCLLYENEGHDWADGGAVYVGGWVRDVPPHGVQQWVFDPVYLCETLDEALYYGTLYNQDEVFDLYRGVPIPVPMAARVLMHTWELVLGCMNRGDYS